MLRVDDVPVLDLERPFHQTPSVRVAIWERASTANIGLLDASDVTLTIPVPENTRLAPEGWGGCVE